MVNVFILIYQYSSYLLILLSAIYQLLILIITIAWSLIYTVISVSSVGGKFLFTAVQLLVQYGYYGLSCVPNGLFSIILLTYDIVVSLTYNGWLLMKDGIWPVIMRCVGFIISMAISVMNIIYNILTLLCGYIVDVSTFSKEFIQYKAGPFIANVLYYMIEGLIDVLEHCYSVIMTILHYITAIMLRVINTLPGTIQPLASDVVYYASEVVAMVINALFHALTWMITLMMRVTGLLVSSPAFWALTLAALMLCYLYYYYIKHWMVTAAPVGRRELKEIRNDSLQLAAGQNNVKDDEVDASAGKEQKLEDEMICVVCQAEKKTMLLQPCNHLCLCVSCVKLVLKHKRNRLCPICREHVVQWSKVYY